MVFFNIRLQCCGIVDLFENKHTHYHTLINSSFKRQYYIMFIWLKLSAEWNNEKHCNIY